MDRSQWPGRNGPVAMGPDATRAAGIYGARRIDVVFP
jgi:hypothetical protein